MDRKAWISITLCLVGLFAWQWWYQKTYGERLAQSRAASAISEPTPQSSPTPSTTQIAAEPAVEIAPLAVPETELAASPEEEIQENVPTLSRKTSLMELEFTPRGGGISSVAFLNHAAEHGERVHVNTHGNMPIGSIGTRPEDLGRDRYSLVSQDSREIVFEGNPAEGLTVRKRYILPDAEEGAEAHVTRLEITFANTSDRAMKSPGYFISTGSITPVHERDLITYTGLEYHGQGKTQRRDVNWFTASKIPLIGIQTRGARPFLLEEAPGLTWAGVKNQYFTSILRPEEGLTGTRVWAKRFDLPETDSQRPLPGINGALGMDTFEIPAGGSVTHSFMLYTGPKKYPWLKSLGGEMQDAMNYGIFKVVSIFLLGAMNFFKGIFGSYAIAIIVLTLCIKFALWPLQNKATGSMRKMAALSPKMTEIRTKYKDDPTRMNQEVMKLYKDYGVNPFGGCLPMLVQIPIFFGFYSMLGSAVELRNSQFFWVQDLSQPDTVFTLGSIPINILPLVMAGTMLWQMAITPKTGDAVQQRIFMFMPLIFLVFCYNFASALALYWTVQNLFSIVQLYLTRDKPLPALTKIPPAEPVGKKRKKR